MGKKVSVFLGNQTHIVPLEGTVSRQVKYKADGHDFTEGKGTWRFQGCWETMTIRWEAVLLHVRNKFLTKVVNFAKY